MSNPAASRAPERPDGGPRSLSSSIPAQGNLLTRRKMPARAEAPENTTKTPGRERVLRRDLWERACLLARRDGVDLRRIAKNLGLSEAETAAALKAELEFATRIRARFRTMLSFVVASTAERLISECEAECREGSA